MLLRYCHIIFALLLLTGTRSVSKAQSTSLNFHHLSVRQGLNDGIINAIEQDRYGYMWFASNGALNRFNGTAVKKYEHRPADSSSAPGGMVFAIYSNSTGRLFFGGDNGLCEFDYQHDSFLPIPGFENDRIIAITEAGPDELILAVGYRLWRYSISKKQKTPVTDKAQTGKSGQYRIHSLFKKGQLLYAGTNGGYLIYDLAKQQFTYHEVALLKGARADELIVDAGDQVWVNNIFQFSLIRIGKNGQETAMHELSSFGGKAVQQSYLDFVADEENVWIATSLTGLIQYNVHTGHVRQHQKNILRPGSLAENILRTIFRAKDGSIWISLLGGVDYFHPAKNVFDIYFPFPSYDANQFARGFACDKQGQYWFSTGDGVTRYDPVQKTYRIWRNESGKAPAIYYNSARALLADGNRVWIATGKGINCYRIDEDRMDFLTEKDSLPTIFYLNINADSRGTIWFCSNMGDGLYYRDPADQKIHSIRNHPVLKKYTGYGVRRVFEDSHQRLWLGFNNRGYAMYDPGNGQTQYWYNSFRGDSSLNGNLVIDITEDRKGVIWLTTFFGVRGIDTEHKKEYWLTPKEGLPSNVTSSILSDSFNRLWIGTSAGLALVNSDRTNIFQLDETWGFPGLEFSEHQAHINCGGNFIFPSNKGYIWFNPASLPTAAPHFPFYIADIEVEGETAKMSRGYQESENLSLSHQENFFTITLEGLNYQQPGQTWYAYKMDGLDKDWHYSRDPKAVYTSVPGGHYQFRYKASASPGVWDMKEKILRIRVGTVFYKTVWFWFTIMLAILLLIYLFYRYRLRQQQRVYILEGKAQQLEKEKTQAMYESLKQQLNPHFLFLFTYFIIRIN